jgi:tetratricopeptide (TPR) repeat protein
MPRGRPKNNNTPKLRKHFYDAEEPNPQPDAPKGSTDSKATELAISIFADPTSFEKRKALADFFLKKKNRQGALEVWQYAIENNPTKLAFVMGKIDLLLALKRNDEAHSALEKIIRKIVKHGALQGRIYEENKDAIHRAITLANELGIIAPAERGKLGLQEIACPEAPELKAV